MKELTTPIMREEIFLPKEVFPWALVYSELFDTRSEAVKREMQIKKKKSRKYIEWVIGLAK